MAAGARFVARAANVLRGDRGSVTVEFVLLVPLLILVVCVVVAFGRLADSRQRVDDAAYQGARAASLARTPSDAAIRAREVVEQALGNAQASCAQLSVSVELDGFAPGGTVRVGVTCEIAASDLSPLKLPGRTTVEAHAQSRIDPFRGTP